MLPSKLLSSQIIEILSKEGALRISEIDDRLVRSFETHASISTVYRHIASLEEQKVVVHRNGNVSLHPLWVDAFVERADELRTAHKSWKPSSIIQLPLREGQTRKFKASSLTDLDTIWNLIQLEVASWTGSGRYVGYNSRGWFTITVPDSEKRVFKSMIKRGVEVNLTYGNASALDKASVDRISIDGFSSQVKDSHQLPRDGYAVWASDQFVVEHTMPRGLALEFDSLFEGLKDIDQLSIEPFEKLFEKNYPCVLKVTKSRKRALQLQELLAA